MPSVPVIVIVYVPPGVDAVVTVSVDPPLPKIEEGEKLAPAPEGNPEALRLTVPA